MNARVHDEAPRLWHLVQERARLEPEGIAFRAKRRGLWRAEGWRALHDASSRLAMALSLSGAVAGERIAVLIADEASWIRAALAVAATGGVLTTLPGDMPQARAIGWLDASRCTTLITDRADLLASGASRTLRVLSPTLSSAAPLLVPSCERAALAVRPADADGSLGTFGEQQLFDLAQLLVRGRSPAQGGHLVIAAPSSSLDGMAARLILPLTTGLVACLPEEGVRFLDTLRDVQPQVAIASHLQWESVWREISLCRLEAAPSHRRLFDLVVGSRRPPAWSPARLLDNLLARQVGLRNCRLAVSTGAAVCEVVGAFYTRLAGAFEQPAAARRATLESDLRSLPVVVDAVLGARDASGQLDVELKLDTEASLRFAAASGLAVADAASVVSHEGLRRWLETAALRLCGRHPRLQVGALRLRLTARPGP